MAEPSPYSQQIDSKSGLLSAVTAYTIWGLFPFYFVAIRQVPALEILAYRIAFSVPFGMLIILLRRQIRDAVKAFITPKTLGLLALAAIALSINWGVYIWAIQIGEIFQGSLGYYINPLLYVIVAVLFFNESLSRLQGLAIAFAALGVSILTIYGGVFPLISLTLAVTFTCYGVLRKYVVVGAMPGLLVEVVVLLPIAGAYLYWLGQKGGISFGQYGTQLDVLLMLAGPITVLPLLAFAFAARRIKLSTLGILQFISPTTQFGCALYLGEPFTVAHGWCFGLIWVGVALFSWDAWRKRANGKPSADH